uniref:26S proteasome non-ATPase regulatory subunit 10 n=1 Tax=Caligus clemensi TaxID=344056 RepID=C1C2G9_CALCM|nr:26S proteasome non-ATPase regulatory subunit 10 [Caligus clemensi]
MEGTLAIQGWTKRIQNGELSLLQREVDESLKKNGSPVQDEPGRTILHWAASLGSVDAVEWFLKNDFNLNASDDALWTPLIIASSAGHEKVVRTLLSFGASVNARTDQGRSAFFYACSRNRTSIANMLADANADMNIQDNLGASPLHRAVGVGHVELLINIFEKFPKLVDPNLRDLQGNTPLHIACEDGNFACLEVFLKAGSDPSIQNKEEKKPIELAPVDQRRKLQNMIDRYLG